MAFRYWRRRTYASGSARPHAVQSASDAARAAQGPTRPCVGYLSHLSGLFKGKQVEGVTLIEYHAVLSSSHNALGKA
jgi:hypothetical protein